MKTKTELLAGQALDRVVPYTWTTLDYEEIHKLLAYHAELIIQECACIADDMKSLDVAKEIKQHFGVEE